MVMETMTKYFGWSLLAHLLWWK